ncbi:uncharacterized protein LOC115627586 [Scaptodrosophila lebanonensis]|uniref:Uncharacterized protein LOC115627586 n=1 Tax=Drosophila lebanonensis TaxID=7225 RepID=A0A6J2TUB5_DROLE|nr:uncharacterized protein LOC115627586 [Scaptodrosophila lebanonensis]
MDLLFLSRRIFLGDGSNGNQLLHGGIIVNTEGTIQRVLRSSHEVNSYLYQNESEAVYDFGELVLMPGLIDANVHINEPGRKDWEGFTAATKAAAAGGYTTIIDRPTNATPATTTVQALKAKTSTARGKIYVDVGFWGGLVPDNGSELNPLLAAGVMGLQCTLCGSAPPVAEEFGAMTMEQLTAALREVDEGALLAFHAELPVSPAIPPDESAPKCYESFLRTRPPHMEHAAVEMICDLALAHPKRHFHIMNLSSSGNLPLIRSCQREGAQLTAETCPHYLTLCAEQVEDCRTEFKTWPPIRERANQASLWQELQRGGALQIISSDHSPATPGARCLTYGRERGNFLKAWPGISSLQLCLPAIWSREELQLADVHRLMCWQPAQLCGLSSFKGRIAEGYDADFCIWAPDEQFTVSPETLYSANKATPYAAQRLRGVVHATVVRGLHVYQQYEGFGQPLGKVLLRKSSKKVVKFVRV